MTITYHHRPFPLSGVRIPPLQHLQSRLPEFLKYPSLSNRFDDKLAVFGELI